MERSSDAVLALALQRHANLVRSASPDELLATTSLGNDESPVEVVKEST
jgi:hypothetical protein